MILLETEIPRTLDALQARFMLAPDGTRIEAWVFEDLAARLETERSLGAVGVSARVHSAYKPLLHAILDEIDYAGAVSLTIHTPADPRAPDGRFRLEAYPLAGMFAGVPITLAPGSAALDYEVIVIHADGTAKTHRVFAPNRGFADHLGRDTLAPCGWLRVWRDDALIEDGPLETEFEAAFAAVMRVVAAYPWGKAMPYFETLDVRIETTGIERPLDYVDECISTREALHEDLYFSLLEVFQRHSGLPPGDRRVQPGQIIPDIRPTEGPTSVRVAVLPATDHPIAPTTPVEIATTPRPLTPNEIAAELANFGGTRFDGRSVQARAVMAAHIPGTSPGFVISAGQHANETSGIVGALRAGAALKARGVENFALIPLANPDGHALHHRLREVHPRHMHHAARYTALGDDLEVRTEAPLYERATRLEAYRRTGALLHLNLHGYPSHEWTRPLTGYMPRGFEAWAVPRGYFLIVRHAPGLADAADWFLRELTARIIAVPGLRAYNERHLATYAAHAGAALDLVLNTIPCSVNEAAAPGVPFTMITEYPDETIYDDAFRLAHEAQTATVLAAIDLFTAPGGLAELLRPFATAGHPTEA
jgi:hypothetical protein